MASLAATRIAARTASPRHLVMLHGIYGRGRNWQAIARALVAARPEYGCWLVDLPYHGDSGQGSHGDTVRGLAMDLEDWLAGEHLVAHVVLGHSFGGKVALAFAALRREQPMQVWVIDSTPDARTPSGSAWDMLAVVRALPDRFATRQEPAAGLMRAGFATPVAQWMTTNLGRHGDTFVWRLDYDAIERLLRDFFATDLWTVVEEPSRAHDIHFLKASESSVISPEAAARIAAARRGSVHLHERQGGHWIHAESPEVVAQLLAEHLP